MEVGAVGSPAYFKAPPINQSSTLLQGPGCFAKEREARLHRWIELKTTDRNTAPHFIPAMLLNKLIEDVLQRDAV